MDSPPDSERHSTAHHNVRAEILADVLDVVRDWQRHPHLDDAGRRALDEIETLIQAEIDTGDPSTAGREQGRTDVQ